MPLPDIQDAITLVEQGRTSEAVPLLERLTEALPLYATAHALLAEAYEGEAQWGEALAAWQRAYFLVPSSPAVEAGLRRAIAAQAPVPLAPAPAEAPEAAPPPPEAEPAAVSEAPKRARRPTSGRAGPQEGQGDGEAEVAPERSPRSKPGGKPLPGTNDLDRLIEELEAVRITPRPNLESLPTPDLDDEIEDMVSETLARIYASQKQYDEAARVYELLAAQQPEWSSSYLEKAAQMRARASDE